MCTDFTDCIKGYSRITFHAQEDDQKGNVCLHIHVQSLKKNPNIIYLLYNQEMSVILSVEILSEV